ncbi:MAG: fasciclin domain-containing protein [Cyclobacteriaceae bacterium]
MRNTSKNEILKALTLVLFLPLLAFTVSCSDDDNDPDPDPQVTQNIVEIAQGSSDLSILVSALTKFPDLVSALSDDSETFTVFAPTNTAFESLLGVVGQSGLDDIPEDVLKRLLQYHVISGTAAMSSGLTDGQTVGTLLTGEEVTVSVDGSSVSIDAAGVAMADVEAVNGIIHIVDAVLVPSLEASIVGTVVEPAYFNKSFTTLTAAVVKAELLSTLIDKSAKFTVFAPTNDAFTAAGITSLDGLEKTDLTPILFYHVLDFEADKETVAGLGTGSAVSSLGGDSYLSINSDGIFLNGTSEVVITDIEADNGVVHVIDKTLLPPSSNVVDIAVAASNATEAEFGQLVAALTAVENDATAANLVTILSSSMAESGAPFTIFAPTDAAFQSLYSLANVADFAALVEAVGIPTIEAVLKYHVVSGARVFSTDLPNLSSTTVTSLGGTFTLDLATLKIADTDEALQLGSSDATIIDTDILGTNGLIHVIDQVILP